MLTYNTMRFGTDEFTFVGKRAMLVAKEPLAPNEEITHLDKFILDYNQPAGTSIRFAFWEPDLLGKRMLRFKKYTTAGGFISLAPDAWSFTPDVEEVLEYGNTVEELLSFTNLEIGDAFKDKYLVIALEGSDDDAPKVKFGMQLSKRVRILETTGHWSYTFDKPTKILDIAHEPILTGDASIDFKYAYIPQGGSSFTAYDKTKDDVIGETVSSLAFKYTRTVTKIDGDDSACAGRYTIHTTEDTDAIVFGDSADLYSITKNYFLPLKYCAVIVKHADLNGAGLKAFAKFDPGKYFVTSENLGTADGSKQTFTLAHAKFFDPSTIKIYLDGVQTQNFEFNVEDNTVTLTATAGTVITAGYTYNLKAETWIELTADPTQHDMDNKLRVTRYHCSDVKQYGDNVMVSAIRLQFIRGDNGNVPHVYGFTAGWAV